MSTLKPVGQITAESHFNDIVPHDEFRHYGLPVEVETTLRACGMIHRERRQGTVYRTLQGNDGGLVWEVDFGPLTGATTGRDVRRLSDRDQLYFL